MGKIDLVSELSLLGKMLGALTAICLGLWFFGEPFLEDYVESHFAKHEEEVKSKVKFRKLVAGKIGCDEDESHIRIGKVVREEEENLDKIWETIEADYKYNKDKRNLIINEIKYIYPGTTLRLE